jgi:hypothetical protein
VATKLACGKQLSGETREVWKAAMKQRYEKFNWSIRDLMTWSGRSYGAVHNLLKEANVKLRARGGQSGLVKRHAELIK